MAANPDNWPGMGDKPDTRPDTGTKPEIPIELCLWCHAHHSQHDRRSFVEHARKWRLREWPSEQGGK
jgi:hypothetical protein